ncbi:hypothetical protein Bca101_066720 [Brassica carinata]
MAEGKSTLCANKSIQIETVANISDLPVNLVEEILSRVPLKSMRAFWSSSLRLSFDAGDDEDDVTLSCVRDEKLAVLLSRNEGYPLEFEIWISTKIEAETVSWGKFLRVDTEMGFHAMVDCVSFFIDEEKKVAMGYSDRLNIVGEDGYLKELELVERDGRDEK